MATFKDGKGTLALAAMDTKCELKVIEVGRPEVGPKDVSIAVQYCGMCHSDVHACNGDWFLNKYPLAPGHEVVGTVKAVGHQVNKFKVGDLVGVGCMVESCQSCELCNKGLENYCLGMVQTYGSDFPKGKGVNFEKAEGYHTNGGYTTDITVTDRFVFHIPEGMKPEYAGILLCAAITTFSPLNRHVLQKGGGAGKKVGVVGFGGLGQMAVKLAKAMGADVTIFSRSEAKADKAQELGADILVHSNADAVKAAFRKYDVVLDTVAKMHDIASLVNTIKVGGTYVLVGGLVEPFQISSFQMLSSNQSIEGTLIGGVPETQQMLDFCSEHNIVPEYEVIHAKDAAEQFQKLMNGTADAKRCVIDISTLKEML